MGDNRSRRSIPSQRDVPSVDDWQRLRESYIAKAPLKITDRLARYRELCEIISRMHWLSVVCFIEQVDPISLALTSELEALVSQELSMLLRFEPLEAYAASLEVLSATDGLSTTLSGKSQCGGDLC